MRIVHVEDYFIPDAGYQINIMPKYLSRFGHEVYIVTCYVEGIAKPASNFFGIENIKERDEVYRRETGVTVIRVKPLSTKTVSDRILQGSALFRKVKELKPDLVYVHGNDTLTGIRYLMKRKLPFALVTDSHMLSMATINRFHHWFARFYRAVVTPRIVKNGTVVIRTQDDPYVEREFGIPLSQAPWISYGTDTLLFHPDAEAKRRFREANGITDTDFVVVYTGKIDEPKGGKLLAETFRKRFAVGRPVVLVAVGTTAGEYGSEVEALFAASENRILRFPTQKYVDLAPFYQAADLSVFARQCSLSFYDAQGCGLPVVSENNNINLDRNSHGNGLCFEAESVDSFRAAVETVAALPPEEYRRMSENAYRYITEHYDYVAKAREYEAILLAAHEAFIKEH